MLKNIIIQSIIIINFKFILIFIFIIILFIFSNFIIKIYEAGFYIQKKENIYKKYNFDTLFESYNKAKDFLNKCLNGILLNNVIQFKDYKIPLVSVIIPVYNSHKFINYTVKSVQNQDLMNLEIILINDFSTDNSSYIIKQLQKNDPRIKIINNKKNMGILYSRSIGALSAKGKYIFPLDNDDLFLDKNVLTIINNIALEGNFDIVEFKGIRINGYINNNISSGLDDTMFSNHKLNLVLFQPELSNFPLKINDKNNNYELISIYLWCKCIKTIIYKRGLTLIGEKKYSRYMLAHEDVIANIILFYVANSYKFVGKYGIFHVDRPDSAFWKSKDNQKNFYELYLTDVAIDLVKNTAKNKKLIFYLILNILNLNLLQKTFKENNNYRILLFSCLDRVLNSNYIPNEYKEQILNKVKSLKFIDYIPFK